MKKLTITMALISTIMIGCGGNSTPDGNEPDSNAQNGTFAYPDNFKSFDNFKFVSYNAVPVAHDGDFLTLPSQILGTFKADLMATTLIEENSGMLKHSHCEEGSASPQELTYTTDPFEYAYFSGGFIYDNSHGVDTEFIGQAPEECLSGVFKDGIISFNHNDEAHTNATLGTLESPLLLDDTGFVGSFEYTFENNTQLLTSTSMRIFKIPSENQEAYISTANYTKMEDVTYSNVRFETESAPNTSIKTTYTLSWRENDIPFVLDVAMNMEENIQSYTYNLQEKGNPAHYVNASLNVVISEDQTRAVTMTYNKEGNEESSTN